MKRPLHKVSRNFNTSTSDIIRVLEEQGIAVDSSPNTPITQEMYDIIECELSLQQNKKPEQEKISDIDIDIRDKDGIFWGDEEEVDSDFISGLLDSSPEDEQGEEISDQDLIPEEEPIHKPSIDEVISFPEKTTEKDHTAQKSSDEETVEIKQEEIGLSSAEPDQSLAKIQGNSIKIEDSEEKNKITGTTVVGSIDIVKEYSPPQKRKLRKRKITKEGTEKETHTEEVKQKEDKKSNFSPKKDKRVSFSVLSVDKSEVKKQVKKTKKILHDTGIQRGHRQRKRKQWLEHKTLKEESSIPKPSDAPKTVEVSEFVTANDLANLLEVSINDIISNCLGLGIIVTINQRLDAPTIDLVCEEFGYKPTFVSSSEEILQTLDDGEEEDHSENIVPRSPIITVMGHVDHGKTSLLDFIRNTSIAQKEHGGITQHIGAYLVRVNKEKFITFLDTPGHQAFTAMRSRGAQITDIVILVVAADDRVMPQTIESINHAKAAGVSIIVAINKIDRPGSSPERIKKQLADHGVLVEEYNGTHQCAEISAKKGTGIDELLEKILIEADLMELKANPSLRATGTVLEARLDRRKGVVINILIQSGTLKVGEPFIAGISHGRVRAMENSYGESITEAGPSVPLQLIGAKIMPSSGDKFIVTKNEQMSRTISHQRNEFKRAQDIRKGKYISLQNLSRQMKAGEIDELKLIIKTDVEGSLEAITNSLDQLSTAKTKVNIIHGTTGDIIETDVLLASASSAIIIGFHVHLGVGIRKLAEHEGVGIHLFNVIYHAVEEIEKAIEGRIKPEQKEYITGVLQVQEVFKVSKIGTIAGCIVSSGKIRYRNQVRVLRKDKVIHQGIVRSLKRFQEDVTEVKQGYECGVGFEHFNATEVRDVFQVYELKDVEK